MCIFHNHESCNILGTCTVHLQKIMRILLRVWIAWLARQKTQYEHQSQKQNNILWFWFSSQPYSLCSNFFLDVGCLLTCLPYFLLFALWCNLNNLWCNKNTVCCPQLLLLEIFICCFHLFYLSHQSYFFQDMKSEPHIFSNVQNWSEKWRPIGNIKIWLEFFSTSFRFQASTVPINQVNMLSNFNLNKYCLFYLGCTGFGIFKSGRKRIYQIWTKIPAGFEINR